MIDEEEVYREKYLKYKKKYLTALENMTGGVENHPIQADSTIYFCLKKTYDRLKLSGRDNSLIKGRISGDNCFIERLSMPLMSLVLSKSMTQNWEFKTIDGKEAEYLNYPFFHGRNFGKVYEETKATPQGLLQKTKAMMQFTSNGSFNSILALKQIKDFQPLILQKLREINPNNANDTDVYYLHTYSNNVSYNGVLKYVSYPTTQQYIDNPSVLTEEIQQGGGNSKYYICNNSAALAIETHYKNTSMNSTEFQATVTNCLEDIALDNLESTGTEPQFATIEELATVLYTYKSSTRRNTQLESKVLDNIVFGEKIVKKNIIFKEIETKSFDEEIAKSQFNDIINRILVWDKQQNVLQYPISIYKLTTSGIIGNTKTLTRITKIEL